MNNKKESEKIVPAICTQCGAKIEVDPSQDAAICPYCGMAFVVEKAVNNYIIQGTQNTNIEHINTVNINAVPHKSVGSLLYFFDKHLDRRNQRKIERDRLKAEKARIAAEREERDEKNTPLIVIAGVIALIAILYFAYKLTLT